MSTGLPTVPNVWDQYPGELPGDYALFLRYLEQGVARSFANVTRSSAGYSYSYVCQLAKAWLWTERAEAYDVEQMSQRRAAFERLEREKLERWSHDQLEVAELATQVIRTELIALIQRQRDGQGGISGTTLTQLMDRVHKWLQISTGGNTESIATTIDLSKLSEADRALLQSEPVRAALESISKQ